MKPETFHAIISRILKEEIEKKSDVGAKTYQRVPEVVHGEDLKKVMPHERDTKSKDDLLNDMDKVVKGLDASFTVVWDDHDDISIAARDLMRIRIIPRWENNYDIEAFTRNEDRIYVTGQKWEQVKEFVKSNLKSCPTSTEKAYARAKDNLKDKTGSSDKGMPQKDKPKTVSTDKAPTETKSKDKNFTEKQVKKETDLPEKPMTEVKDIKKQVDHKVADPVKLRKRTPDTKLVVKQS